MENSETYKDMVSSLAKPGEEINDSLTPIKSNLLHMVLGISGEAGEILDAIKKHVIYNKGLDLEHVIEELGDLEFYLEGLRQQLLITREHTLNQNMTKTVNN